MDSPTLSKPPIRPRPSARTSPELRDASEVREAPAPAEAHEEQHDQIPSVETLPRPSRATLVMIGLALLTVLAVGLIAGLLPRLHQSAEMNAEAEAAVTALPPVSLQYPRQSPGTAAIDLPGNVQPLQETAIYARTTGYLKRWVADYGAHVKAGDLLAEIDAPELDQQLQQAKADLASAQANLSKAQLDLTYIETTLKRYEGLIPTNGVTPQELDQHRADAAKARTALAQAKATVASDQANVGRLEDLQSFEKVYAPFSGTITARNYDVGAMITANGASQSMPLFRIAQTDVLRVFVSVPQYYAPSMKVDLPAYLSVREFPGVMFNGKVAHTAGALDSATRTLLTEVRIPNPDGKLLAGMYGQIKFELADPAAPLIVPVSALIDNSRGSQIAVVDGNDILHLKKVEIGRDFGTEVEITSGLSPQDRIVTNPGERLVDGGKVRVISAPPQPRPEDKPGAAPLHHGLEADAD